MSDPLGHYIDGKTTDAIAGRTLEVRDPATGGVLRHVAMADAGQVDQAVESAAAAATEFARTTLASRAKLLFDVRELVASRQEDLAAVITEENGKVLADAMGEVARGLEVIEFACNTPHLLKGSLSRAASSDTDVHSYRQPLGPVAVITPFNFPAMVPLWFLPIAIAAGNAVVLKPSEKAPSAAHWLAELFSEAGLPPGVFNVVHGDGEAVGRLLSHPLIQAVSFVGSTPVARHVYTEATRHGKRVQALGGAKNHMVVLPDAELDLAADAAVNAAYGAAGERCMAVSVVVAVGSVAEDLADRIATRAAALRVGDGRRECDMGPLITAEHRDRVASHVETAVDQGATALLDGRTTPVDGASSGYWLGPTLLTGVTADMDCYTEEIFGPVLGVVRVESLDEAIELVNANPYGNGTAVFTRDGAAARRFEQEVTVGMVGINVPIPVPTASYSFGGWKSSLFGDAHAYGAEGLQFFTRGKVVTSRWRQPAGTGLELDFPQTS